MDASLPVLDMQPAVGGMHTEVLPVLVDDHMEGPHTTSHPKLGEYLAVGSKPTHDELPLLPEFSSVGGMHAEVLPVLPDGSLEGLETTSNPNLGEHLAVGSKPTDDELPLLSECPSMPIYLGSSQASELPLLPDFSHMPGATSHMTEQLPDTCGDEAVSDVLPNLDIVEEPSLLSAGGWGGELPVLSDKHASSSNALGHSGCSTPAVGSKKQAVSSKKLAVGSKKPADARQHMTLRLACKSTPWVELPYLRREAFGDIGKISAIYGADLLGISPGEEWLDPKKARHLLENSRAKQWCFRFGQHGDLESFSMDDPVDFMEIFSGCGHLTASVARSGVKVGPSIDRKPGIGHADVFTVDVLSVSDRKLLWALIVVFGPRWLHAGFPCTFWVAISHWTRTRDLDANEASRLEALVFIILTRQLVYYQASRRRHSSIENPPASRAWNLDVVKDLVVVASLGKVVTDLCAWGSKDPVSGKYYHKPMQFACSFDIRALACKCPRNHEHEVVKGTISQGPFKGRQRSAISGQYPVALCDVWASLAKSKIM